MRTHYCGELNARLVGSSVTLCGLGCTGAATTAA